MPTWQAASDRGDKSAIPLCVCSDEIIAAVQLVVTKPARRYAHNGHHLTASMLLDAMTAWLYEEATMKFNYTADVCEHATVQIGYGFLEQYQFKTAATSFNGLMEERRPTEFSDDAGMNTSPSRRCSDRGLSQWKRAFSKWKLDFSEEQNQTGPGSFVL